VAVIAAVLFLATPAPVAFGQPTRPATNPSTGSAATRPAIRGRVYFDTNLTPIAWIENPRWINDGRRSDPDPLGRPRLLMNPAGWIEYATARGFVPVMFAYTATLNRAFVWADDDGNPRPMRVWLGGGRALNWKRGNENHCDPPNLTAVRAVARLAAKPATYGFGGPPRAVVFDLEQTKTMNLTADVPTATRREMVARWVDAVRAVKAEGVDAGIWFGPPFWPEKPDTIEDERRLAAELPALWVETYNTDLTVTREQYVAAMDRVAATVRGAFPNYKGRIVATVCPFWQIIWPQNDPPEVAALKDKPVDLERWEWQMRHLLADRGWDVAIWVGQASLEQFKPQADVLANVAGLGSK
jgi:hypothetical protein